MARIYAGILGPLAFLTAVARGLVHGGTVEHTLLEAWIGLVVFSIVGFFIGWIAGATIDESVNAQIAREVAAQESAESPEPAENEAAG